MAFLIITLSAQGSSHLVINYEHYQALGFMRVNPIFPLGIIAILIQGSIMTYCLHLLAPQGATIRLGLMVSLTFGLFLASYISFASPSKYDVGSIINWISVEFTVSLIQFTSFGIIMGYIHSFVAKKRSQLVP